jgi:hypothetical protein
VPQRMADEIETFTARVTGRTAARRAA